jgi:hypothetical protein
VRCFLLLLALLLPSIAVAEQPAQALLTAFDLPFEHLDATSVSTTYEDSFTAATMLDVRDVLGTVVPQNGSTMALLSTGNVNNVVAMDDYDHPPGGALGDRASLSFRMQVPDWASSYGFQFNFLSREYPEWVGDQYDDNFEVFVENPAWSGQVVFDAFGNPVSVNSALFAETNPANLVGTGFDEDGATGWVTTIAPVEPGSVLDITFTIGDEADGVWDSAVLLDGFGFSAADYGDDPITSHELPWEPVHIAFVSPKTGPIAGGHGVTLFGAGFKEGSTVEVDGVDVGPVTVDEDAGTIRIQSMPPGGGEGRIHMSVRRPDGSAHTLFDSYSYTMGSTGGRQPRVWSAAPDFLHIDGGTTLELRGDGMENVADVLFVPEVGPAVPCDQLDLYQDGADLMLYVITPQLIEGWAEVVVVDLQGNRIEPGYPVQFASDAPLAGAATGDQVGCSTVAGQGWLLLPLLAMGRRRRSARLS